jgi:hypothetical protein
MTFLRRLYDAEKFKVGDKIVAIYEMVKGGRFTQFFGSLGDLDSVAFPSWKEVDKFCRDHPDRLGERSNFFLCKEGEEFIVARVFVYDSVSSLVGKLRLDNEVWDWEMRRLFALQR